MNGWSKWNGIQMATAISIALSILVCAGYKASHTSMTHDESSTYLNLVDRSELNLWSCHHNPYCWSTANNHLLNTVLMRWTASIIGPTEFALRLPNLLLLVVYLLCVILILREVSNGSTVAFVGITLLAGNPFVLDFFALARGYGMGLGFVMLSLFAAWRFIARAKDCYIVLSVVAAVAAVFANLTYLAYLVALFGAAAIHFILTLRRPRKRMKGMVILSIVLCLAFLFWYFYLPVQMLMKHGEFEFGTASMWKSWLWIVRDSLYGVTWFGERTIQLVATGSAYILGLCVITAWFPVRNADKKLETEFGRFLSVLVVLLIAFFVVNHEFTGASYPSGRKAIIFYTPVALLVLFVLSKYLRKNHLISLIIGNALGILILAHFYRAFTAHTYREWWYDASTKEMVYSLVDKTTPGDSVSLSVEWLFHPSTHFYVQTQHLPVDLMPYSRDISKDNPVEYYYLHPDQAKVLEPEFILEKNFEGRLLMKRQ